MSGIVGKAKGTPLDLLRNLSAAGKHVFTVADAREHLPNRAPPWLALTRLLKARWIKRLKRGVYLIIPLEAGVERQWAEEAFVIACTLTKPASVAYWSAMRHWNWTTQVLQTVFVQTTQRQLAYTKSILGVTYRLIPVVSGKFYGVRREHIGPKVFNVTDREKTLLDILDRPDLSGGMPEVLNALPVAVSEIEWTRLDEYLIRFPNRTVVKRLGVLVESLSLTVPDRDARLARWGEMVSRGVAFLDPGSKRRAGPIQTKWRIRMNLPIRPSEGR